LVETTIVSIKDIGQLNPFYPVCILFLTIASLSGQVVKPDDRVCGKWESTGRDLIMQVYKRDGEFRAKIFWFADTGGKPLDYWKDVHNPNPALRSPKWVGMSILRNLTYQPDTGTWEKWHGLRFKAWPGMERICLDR
jgi:hypothetical protein